MSELGRIVGQQVASWVAVNQKAIQRRALLVGRLVLWAGRYKSSQVYAFNDMVMFRSYIALAMEDSPRGLPQPGGAGWSIVANLATGGVDNFPDVAAESALALNTPVEVVTSAISRWAMKQIEDAVTSVPGLVRWRGWWSSGEAYQDRDLVLHNRSVWLNTGGDGPPSRNGWEWLLSTQSGNVPEVGIPAPVLAFHALVANDDGIMVGVKTGIGPLTADHAASIYAANHEGVYKPFSANEPVWAGGRKGNNYALHSDDLENPVWALSSGTLDSGISDPDGGNTAFRLTGTTALRFNNNNMIIGATVRFSSWIRRQTGSGQVRFYNGHGSSSYIINPTSEWQRMAAQVRTGYPPSNNTCGWYVATEGDQIDIWHPQMEDITGNTNQSPSEYLETDASINKKIYSYANGNSVASNVVTEAKGADFAEAPRLQDNPATTNLNAYGRQMGAWSNLGTPTVTQDATGIDGQSNKAFTIDDDDASGYDGKYLDVVVTPDTERLGLVVWVGKEDDETSFPSISLKASSAEGHYHVNKKTGALTPVYVSAAGIEAEVVNDSADFWKVCISFPNINHTVAQTYLYAASGTTEGSLSPSATGSAVFDCAMLTHGLSHAQIRALSPIFTEGSAESIDSPAYSVPGSNHQQTNYGYSFYWTPTYNTAEVADKRELLSLADNPNLSYYDGANGEVESTDGTNTISAVQPVVPGTTYQISIAIGQAGGNQLAIAVDDGPWQEGPYDGGFDEGTLLQLFRNHGYVGYMHDLQGWSGDYDVVKQQLDVLRGAA